MQPQYIARQHAYARLRLIKDAQRLGNVAEACRRHHVCRKTFYKCKARYDGTIESLLDRSRRPQSHPNQLSAQEHALVDRVARRHKRKGLYWLHWLLRTFHGFTRSVGGLYKALKRLGFYARQRAFAAWITYYNHQRHHGSLNWRPPAQRLRTCRLSQSVTYD